MIYKQLTPLELAALRVALVKLTDLNGNFYISSFDQMCKVYGVAAEKRDHDALSLLHCVPWKEMDKETRQLAVQAILRTFGAPESVISQYQETVAEPHTQNSPARLGFFQRLLGAGR